MSTQGWRYQAEVEGRTIDLPEGEVSIGRSRACTLALKDVTVSRHHATLWFESGRAKVVDSGSANGTFLNGRRFAGQTEVVDGDRVTVGETEIVVHLIGPPVPSEATVRLEIGQSFCARCGALLTAGSGRCAACGAVVPLPAGEGVSTVFTPPPPVPEPPLPFAPAPPPAPAAAPVPAPVLPPPAPPAPPPFAAQVAPPPLAAPAPPSPPAPAPPPPRAAHGEVLSSIREVELAAPPPAPARAAVRTAAPAIAAAGAFAPAGFWIRVAASLVDSLLFVLVTLVFTVLRWVTGLAFLSTLGSLVTFAAALLLVFVGWGIYGTSPGKALFGIYVHAEGARPGQGIGTTKALIRWLGYLLGSLLLCIGFLLVAFRSDKRGLHDLLAGTWVVRRV